MFLLKRSKLLLLIAGGQFACLTLGVLWCSGWLHRSVADGKRVQILQSNEAFACFLAERIEEELARSVSPLAPDGNHHSGLLALSVEDHAAPEDREAHQRPDWELVQHIVESFQLPNAGFAYVVQKSTVNDEGVCQVLCRPRDCVDSIDAALHATATLKGAARSSSFQELLLQTNRNSIVSGFLDLSDGRHLIAAKDLAGYDATVLVHQRDRIVQQAVDQVIEPFRLMGLGFATLVTLLGMMVDTLILQRYEGKLAEVNERLEQLITIRTKSLVKTRNAIIFGLAKLAESRDTDTGEHLERIRGYVTVLAAQLATQDRAIDRDFISNLALASSLHDIGKVGIPDAVLLKPGRLDPEERKIIEQHPIIGRKCLEAIQRQLGSDDFLEMARMIADSHHERWDGNGYPKQLKGEDIPLVGRIVALADVYDALTSKRPYKEPMSHGKACQIISEGRGTHFDPKIVDAFLNTHEQFSAIAREHAEEDGLPSLRSIAVAMAPDVNALLSQSHANHER